MRISDWSSDVCSSDLRFRRETDASGNGGHRRQSVPAVVGSHFGILAVGHRSLPRWKNKGIDQDIAQAKRLARGSGFGRIWMQWRSPRPPATEPPPVFDRRAWTSPDRKSVV